MSEIRVYGPYISKENRAFVILVYPPYNKTAKRKTTSYARWLMQNHLGRELEIYEIVDHINEDHTDDRIENLQLVTTTQNNQKAVYSKYGSIWETFICMQCGKEGKQKRRDIKHNRKQGKSGPFCGRSCAGRYSTLHIKSTQGITANIKETTTHVLG